MNIEVGSIVKIERDGKVIAGIMYEVYPGFFGNRMQAPGYGKIKNIDLGELQEATMEDIKATAEQAEKELLAKLKANKAEVDVLIKSLPEKIKGDLLLLTPENIIARETAETEQKKAASGGGDEGGSQETEEE